MTIDEAIRIKGLVGDEFLHADPDDIDEAERLSVEALKHVKEARQYGDELQVGLLPGETEESEKQPLVKQSKPS